MSNKESDALKDEAYIEAEKARYEAEKRDSKSHDMPLVVRVEESDGKVSPVYREEL